MTRVRDVTVTAATVVLVMMLIVSLRVPTLHTAAADRWGLRYSDIDRYRLLPLTPIPVLVLVLACTWQLIGSLRRGDTYRPHFLVG